MHQMRQQRKGVPSVQPLNGDPALLFRSALLVPPKNAVTSPLFLRENSRLRPARRRIAVSDAVCYSGARRICMIHKIHGGGDLTAEHLSLGYASTHICGTLNDRFPGPYCRNVARLSEWAHFKGN